MGDFQKNEDFSFFVTLKRHTPDKFDQFLEDNFLSGRAISMTLCMKITVTIVLVLRYLPVFHTLMIKKI
jgi:hypothetical protein